MEDIHDIQPPVQVGIDPLFIKTALIIAGILILAGLLYLLIRFFLQKRKKPSESLRLLPPPLPPLEAALKAISDLENYQAPDLRWFYFQLTAILKKYMGRVFLFHAVEMTTQEFVKAIHKLNLGKDSLSQIIDLMDGSDRIKYAGDIPPEKMIHDDLARMKNIVIRVSENFQPREESDV